MVFPVIRVFPVNLGTGTVSGMSNFGRGSFQPDHFGLGRFGLILGSVVSAQFGRSFRPEHLAPLDGCPLHV